MSRVEDNEEGKEVPKVEITISGFIRVIVESTVEVVLCLAHIIGLIVAIENVFARCTKLLNIPNQQSRRFAVCGVKELTRPHMRIMRYDSFGLLHGINCKRARASSSSPRACSGDIYATVPTVVSGLVR